MSRTDAVTRDFMQWLLENNERHPNPEDYLDHSPSAEGTPVTADEFERVVTVLDGLGLIKGMKTMGRHIPLRARLTEDGVDCAARYGGDLRAWESGRGLVSTVDSTAVDAAHGELDGDSPSVDLAGLVTASRDVEGVLPVLPESARPPVIEAIEHVRDADRRSDGREAKRWGERLLQLVTPLAGDVSVLKYVVDGLASSVGKQSV